MVVVVALQIVASVDDLNLLAEAAPGMWRRSRVRCMCDKFCLRGGHPNGLEPKSSKSPNR